MPNREKYEQKVKRFTEANRSLVEAPAGYGKTYTITEAVKSITTDKKVLILTHTNAGVDSIKDKINKRSVKRSKCKIQTICSFAENYTKAFTVKNKFKEKESFSETSNYYQYVEERATDLIKNELVRNVIEISYSHLFIDEYQDCSPNQHKLIKSIDKIIPVHALGDPMQGIFEFRGSRVVDWQDEVEPFFNSKEKLETPWRWKGDNEEFGKLLSNIREELKKGKDVYLKKYNHNYLKGGSVINGRGLTLVEVDTSNYVEITNCIEKIIRENSYNELLVIHYAGSAFDERFEFFKKLYSFSFLEAITCNDFFKIAKKIDNLKENPQKINSEIRYIFNEYDLFAKTGLKKWIKEDGSIRERRGENKEDAKRLKNKLKELKSNFSFAFLVDILNEFKCLDEVKCCRAELYSSIIKALEIADYKNISTEEAMIKIRNYSQSFYNKNSGFIFGTTLLVKGLEFKNVLLVEPNKFKNKENFYVALTRATENLIVVAAGDDFKYNPQKRQQKMLFDS